ncbi:MAG: glutaminase A [Ilumatobacter sp.]
MANGDPETSPVLRVLHEVYASLLDHDAGEVATYIPELADCDPDQFGIAVALTDGHVYEVGDSRSTFTIQSVSKAFAFALALADHGRDELLSRVGVEPTGDAFNSIELDDEHNRPPNPMVNAGAIAVTGLVEGTTRDERWRRIATNLDEFAGRSLDLDESVAASEAETGHRNRAIAHLMRGSGMIRPDVDEVLDLYFHQCAVNVTAVDLAIMGATLAAGGRNPLTGNQVIGPDETASVLSVMGSCGMYDWSGEWNYRVGLPAKSGVGGGIVAVITGLGAIGVFSPRLDAQGNSVRGLQVCERLSREFGLHQFAGRRTTSPLRAAYGAQSMARHYRRLEVEEEAIRQHGEEIQVIELQGVLAFDGVEALSRHMLSHLPGTVEFVLDFRRVVEFSSEAKTMLFNLVDACRAKGIDIGFAAASDAALNANPDIAPSDDSAGAVRSFPSVESAIEAAEDRLLSRHESLADVDGIDFAAAAVCAELAPSELEQLMALTRERTFGTGEILARRGDPTSSAWVVLGGVIAIVTDPDHAGDPGKRIRLVGPGSLLGEASLLSGQPRTARMRAETPVRLREIDASALATFTENCPDGAVQLLKNIAITISGWLRD